MIRGYDPIAYLDRAAKTHARFLHVDHDAREIDARRTAFERGDGLARLRVGAIDRIEPEGLMAMQKLGLETFQGQQVTELARAIKGPDDIKAMSNEELMISIENLKNSMSDTSRQKDDIELTSSDDHKEVRDLISKLGFRPHRS